MLVGIIQGLIFVLAVSTSKKYQSESTTYLLMMILAFTVNNLEYFINDSQLVSVRFFFDYLYIPVASLSAVFFYFYVRQLLFPEKRITKKLRLLYLPFLLFLIASIIFKCLMAIVPSGNQDQLREFFWDLYLFQEFFSWAFSVVLIVQSYILVRKYEQTTAKADHLHSPMHLRWLKATISILAFFLCVVWVALTILDMMELEPSYYILWIGMAITVYWLGHIGIYKFGIAREREEIREYATHINDENPTAGIQQNKKNAPPKNKNIDLLQHFIIVEKNFLDNNLTLEKTADALNLNKSYLSRIFNQEMTIGFSDYINHLRVEEAKKYLHNPDFENYTLVAIGLEAGFNSKTTFNNAFKKFTGKTPSEYKKELHKKTQSAFPSKMQIR